MTLEQIGKFDAQEKRGEIPKEQLDYYKQHACPSCGACSFMGTASTMQIMAEALGLMLPGTALMPATAPELKQAAYDAGVQLMKLVEQGIKAKDIVTMKSFENAIMVHVAISGSTNATMHIPAIAHEFGFEIDADTFDPALWTTGISFQQYDDYPAISTALSAGEVDAFCVDKSILAIYKTDGRSYIDDKFSPQEYGVATTKGSGFSAYVDELVQGWLADGTIDSLITENGLE